MPSESVHVAEVIDRSPADVYAYAVNPANLPEWASGLSSGIDQVDGEWVTESPMGTVKVTFEKPNDLGILDHWVSFPDGSVTHNPVRVVPLGEGSEVVFSVRRSPGFSDDEFARDVATVTGDLATLKRVLER